MKSSIFKTLRVTLIVLCASTAIISPAQTKLTTLFSFNGNNGADPHYVNLVQGADGSLYGTTYVSTGTGGTVFKITTGGTLTTLHTFCSEGGQCLDGAEPNAGLLLNENGDFFGTTLNGGASNNGTVFEISPLGTLTTLHSFDMTDGAQPQVALIQAHNAIIYGTTTEGGTGAVGTIFQIDTADVFTSLHSFNGADGDYPNSRLLQGANGNFYGTTYEGGGGSGSIYEITPSGAFTTLHSFDAAEADGNTGGLIQASNGNFYGTAFGGGGNSGGTVFEMTPAGQVTVIYNFCSKLVMIEEAKSGVVS